MAIVGRAEVVVHALADQFREDLRRSFQQLEKDADDAGTRGGKRYGGGFSREANRGIGGVNFDGLGTDAERAGDDHGTRYGGRFHDRLGGALGGSGAFDGLAHEAERAGKDTGDVLKRELENGAKDAGRSMESEVSGAGNNIGRNLSAIKFDLPDIGGGLATKIIALIPLVGILGGALAALVGGLTAMAAAAAFAAGSLSILATGLSVVAGGAITGILAFGGIGKALSALGAAQAASGKNAVKAGRQQESAARAIEAAQERVRQSKQRVEDAEYSLAQARKQASDDAVRDARAVADAERHLSDTQKEARQAQLDLNQARLDAKNRLEDLQLQLRGSVLSEEEATIRLHRARQNLQQTLADPKADADARKQAEIDLQQAELALDEASKRRRDVTKETADANKAGIEGAPQVVKAKDDINKANQRVADAEQSVADARKKQRDDAISDAHAIMKAQRELADAQRAAAQAVKDLARAQHDAAQGAQALSSAADKAKAALAALSPEAQKFVKYLFALKPVLKDLRNAAGQDLFGPLTIAIQTVKDGFLPTFRSALKSTGGALGEFARQLAHGINVQGFKDNFKNLAAGNVQAFGLLGHSLADLFRGVTGLALAAQPLFIRFLKWIGSVTHAFAGKFEGKKNLADMTALIGRMGDEAAKIGHIFGATFGIIGNIFKAALPSGQALNTSLLTTLVNFRKWTGDPAGQKRMHAFFQNIIPPVKAIGRFVVALSKAFLKLGEDGGGKKGGGGIVKTFDLISKNLPKVGHAIETFTNKTAPAIIKIIAKIVDAFDKLSSSPALNVFFGIVSVGISIIKGFIDVLQWGPIGKFTGTLLGLVAAFIALKKVAKVTGLKALFQAGQQAAAPVGTDRAKRSSGLGAFGQGLRGRRVVAKDMVTGKDELTGEDLGKRRLSNRLGTALSPLPVGRAPAGRHAAPRPQRRLRLPRGEGGAVRPGVAGGAAVAVAVGLAIAPALMHGDIKGLKEATANIGSTIKDNLSTILMLAGPAIFGKLGPGAKVAGKGISAAFQGSLPALKSVGGVLGKLGGPIAKAASLGLRGIGFAMRFAMGPVGLIIIGVTLLAAGLIYAYKHSERFRNIVDTVGRALKAVGEFILGTVIRAFKFLKDHIQLVLLALGPLGIAISAIITVFKHWDEITKIVGKVVDAVVDFFKKLPGRILGAINGIGSAIGGFLSRALSGLGGIANTALTAVVSYFTGLPGRVVRGLGNIGSAVGGALRNAFSGLANVARGPIDDIVGFFRGLPGRIGGFVTSIGSAAGRIGTAIFNGIKNGLSGALGAVADLGKSLLKGFQDLLNNFIVDRINNAIPDKIKLKGLPDIDLPDNPIPRIHFPGLAKGGTVLPRPGGTLAVLGEAGRAESVVDTGLINRRLRDDQARENDTVAELRRVRAVLERISTLSGLTIENINATAAPGEQAATSVPRALRSLAFELGA